MVSPSSQASPRGSAQGSPAPQPPRQPAAPAQPTAQQASQLATVLVAGGVLAATGVAQAVTVGGAGALDAAIVRAILKLLRPWGFTPAAVRAAVTITLSTRRDYAPDGPASAANAAREPVYDAWYLLNAARRMQAGMAAGKTADEVLEAERRHRAQREKAAERRREAAERVDREASLPGPTINERRVLMWRAHPDDKVTWECAAADGRWFYADTPPLIGYPGMPHGGTCRCWSAQPTPLSMLGNTVDDAVRSAQSRADHPADRYPKPARPAVAGRKVRAS